MEKLGSIILSNTYRDSVFLMKISSKITSLEGIIEASAMMATERNKDLFLKSGLSNSEISNAKSDDLVISIKAVNDDILQSAIKQANDMLSQDLSTSKANSEDKINSLEKALELNKEANILMLSCAGDYAKYEAIKGLNKGLNIMLYSDNISIENELQLKTIAHKKGLLVMGPDCGTSIINHVPLAFANTIREGCIGIVGASGTGIQEVSSIIQRCGSGISQAIGTGGRDPKEFIGGITMMDALQILQQDESTKIILIVSKPPCQSVKNKIVDFISKTNKPIVVNYAGEDDYNDIVSVGGYGCDSLEEAAIKSITLDNTNKQKKTNKIEINETKLQNEIEKLKSSRKYIRGIYGGGSLCYEGMHYASRQINDLYSNTPMEGVSKLKNVRVSQANTFLDMGEDEFTVGKPHPMIDPTEKVKRIKEELTNPDVAVVLTDCVIGYGSCDNPAKEIANVIQIVDERTKGDRAIIVASVCGSEEDYQVYSKQVDILQKAGVYVMASNIQATKLCMKICNKVLGGKAQ